MTGNTPTERPFSQLFVCGEEFFVLRRRTGRHPGNLDPRPGGVTPRLGVNGLAAAPQFHLQHIKAPQPFLFMRPVLGLNGVLALSLDCCSRQSGD